MFDGSNPEMPVEPTTYEQWNGGGDVTLLQAIADGTIDKPSRLTWVDWQKWRKNPFGGRRATTKVGSARPTTNKEDSKIWSETMAALYGENWLVDLHGEEEELQAEDEERSQQVAASAETDLPPGLERAAVSVDVPVPTQPMPTTPSPASKRKLSPLVMQPRPSSTTPGSSVGTGRGSAPVMTIPAKKPSEAVRSQLLQDSPAGLLRRSPTLEASPAQKLKDLRSAFPSTHRGLGFLDASKGAAWKAVPPFPKGGDVPLERRTSEPTLPPGPDRDEEANEGPSPMFSTSMICSC